MSQSSRKSHHGLKAFSALDLREQIHMAGNLNGQVEQMAGIPVEQVLEWREIQTVW